MFAKKKCFNLEDFLIFFITDSQNISCKRTQPLKFNISNTFEKKNNITKIANSEENGKRKFFLCILE